MRKKEKILVKKGCREDRRKREEENDLMREGGWRWKKKEGREKDGRIEILIFSICKKTPLVGFFFFLPLHSFLSSSLRRLFIIPLSQFLTFIPLFFLHLFPFFLCLRSLHFSSFPSHFFHSFFLPLPHSKLLIHSLVQESKADDTGWDEKDAKDRERERRWWREL